MTALTNAQIKALEDKGFKRWTKGGYDRMYIDAQYYGAEFTYYKTGNISSARFNGELISNCVGRRLKGGSVFIDVKTGELHLSVDGSFEDQIRENVQAIVDGALASVEEPEESEEPEEAASTMLASETLSTADAKAEAIAAATRSLTDKRPTGYGFINSYACVYVPGPRRALYEIFERPTSYFSDDFEYYYECFDSNGFSCQIGGEPHLPEPTALDLFRWVLRANGREADLANAILVAEVRGEVRAWSYEEVVAAHAKYAGAAA